MMKHLDTTYVAYGSEGKQTLSFTASGPFTVLFGCRYPDEYNRTPKAATSLALQVDSPSLSIVNNYHRAYYPLPNDCLRVWRVSLDIQTDPLPPTVWRKEGNYLVVDDFPTDSSGNPGVVYIQYARRVRDPSVYSDKFKEAFEKKLAMAFCVPEIESNISYSTLLQEYEKLVNEAGGLDGSQASSEVARSNTIIDARRGG